MIAVDGFRDFIQSTTTREVAGIYVCGKWSKNIYAHRYIINITENATVENKIQFISDEEFQNRLKDLINSWMGYRNNEHKITFAQMNILKQALADVTNSFAVLNNVTILNYNDDVHGEDLERILRWAQKICRTDAKVVATSKFLHHILPGLIVPVDRTYTEKFFKICTNGNIVSVINYNNVNEIRRLTKVFNYIAKMLADKIEVETNKKYADTSYTKAIDNWIIMYVDLRENNLWN
jgi:hypothetical protein